MTTRTTTRGAALLAAGTLFASLAACSDDDAAEPTGPPETNAVGRTVDPPEAGATASDLTSAPTEPDTIATEPESAATTETGESSTGESSADEGVGDVCALVPGDLVAQIFPSGDVEEESNDYGAGFAECSWEDETSELLVSVVPSSNLQTDYVDQLVEGPAVDSDVLGDDAIGFAGLVGIGRASSSGTSVGFGSGELGFIVAVRSGDDGSPADDLPIAVEIAEAIAQR